MRKAVKENTFYLIFMAYKSTLICKLPSNSLHCPHQIQIQRKYTFIIYVFFLLYLVAVYSFGDCIDFIVCTAISILFCSIVFYTILFLFY